MKRYSLLGLLLLMFFGTTAQTSPSSSEIYLGLRKLNVLGSVLYVAAHPDDENTRLLTYFSKDRLYRTGYLSLTRGDGGQNLIGEEQGIELGLIRTQELLAARRIDGAEQFFTRAYDFGYSKTPAETFTKWDKEKILADVVWVIRKFQPDVIITRFPTTGEGGHGHHTASAILANEAFTAAADPKRYPEQLQYVQPWQARRILWNTFNFGNNNTQREDQFKFDVGGYNPVLGKSYGEIAADSRSQHKSQGFGVPRSRGEAMEFFSSTGGGKVSTDLFEAVPTDWKRVKGGEAVAKLIESAIASFDFLQPHKSIAPLVRIYKAIDALPQSYWRDQKLKETKALIEDASGLWVEAFSPQQYVVQGDSVRINLVLNDRMGTGAQVSRITLNGFDTTLNAALTKNKNFTLSKTLPVSREKAITQPYWLEHRMSEGYYTVNDQQLIGQPDVSPSYKLSFTVNLEGEPFVFEKPIRYKFTDPVRGELYQPLVVLPPYTLEVPSRLNILVKGTKKPGMEELTYTAQKDLSSVKIYTDKKDDVIHDSAPLRKGGIKSISRPFEDRLAGSAAKGTTADSFAIKYYQEPGKTTAKSLHTIKYDHIPYINYFTDAQAAYVVVDLKTAGKKIGYIVGAGDKVPEALEQMGYEVTMLTDKELSRNNLRQFDAIISGVRAYNTNEWLNKHHEKLMKYVEGGGNLIVQYNTSNQIGPVRAKIGPYNFNISRTRITDEKAAVTLLKPGHSVLNFPNKISGEDFTGWVQERSIYHATGWDKAFEPILSMSDPGESAEEGSLIIAKHGKGYFTYTGLVFFRQLPAGVPGAYRLLANLIALNQKKEI
ncbi:MAG TPA: PIG-L family deacetylase [Chitinophagaceae bacterium]